MAFKKLSSPTGELADNKPKDSDSSSEIKRDAILVHSGPDGSGLVFLSADGETKPFDTERIKRIVENQNRSRDVLVSEYGGEDKIPQGAFPPLLDQHENDSNDRIIGRLTGKLRLEVRDVPKVGKNVACAVCETTWLGEDTVKKVKDGRIYHLSIGIDEDLDVLGETSAVIEPAAPGAMLLEKGKKNSKTLKGESMPKINKKRLQAHKKRMTALESIKTEVTTLTKSLDTTKSIIHLAKRQGQVAGRLTRLMRAGKITPAEAKKMDVKKLSALPDEALETVMGAYEALEPKVLVGQRGTTDGVAFAEMGMSLEARQKKRLKSEMRKDLKRLGAKLKDGDDEDKDLSGPHEEEIQPGKDPHAVAGEEHQLSAKHMESMSHHLEEMGKHMASGDMAKCKSAHMEMKKCMEEMSHGGSHLAVGDVKSEDEAKSGEETQKQIDELNTQMSRLAGLVSQLYDSEKEEGHDLEQGEQEEEEQVPKHKTGAVA